MMCSVLVVLMALTMNAAARDIALLEVVIYDPLDNGDYTTRTYDLEGSFSIAGQKISAEGDIIQMHPLGLCNNSENDDLVNYGWVGVVKLETPMLEPKPCLSVFGKAKRAIQRGATAVIFDVTDHPSAVEQLRKAAENMPLSRPVIIVGGEAAFTLMSIVSKQRRARARIQYTPPRLPAKGTSNEYFNMGIFIAFFILISIVCLLLLLKIKWRQRRKQTSLTRLAAFAISKMETRKYRKPERSHRRSSNINDSWSLNSDSSMCAICLEEFQEGEELRVVSCSHEFHKHCVDPWLIRNRTCPLCLHNIIEYPSSASILQSAIPYEQSSRRRRRFFNLRLPRRRHSSSASLSTHNAVPQSNLVCAPRPNNQANLRDLRQHRNFGQEIQTHSEHRRGVQERTSYCGCRSQLNFPNQHWGYCPHVLPSHHRHYHSNTYYEHHIDYVRQQELTLVDEYQHRLVPVVVQLRTPEISSSGYDGSVSNNMDASSSSSISLTAPCQDWSDHSGNGSENIDSNQSVYGSSSTFRSDPCSVDPHLYSRRPSDPLENLSSDSMDNLPPTRLTPSCMLRKKQPYDSKPRERLNVRNSYPLDSISRCEHTRKSCKHQDTSDLPNLRHTFTSTGQCAACAQLLRLPGKVQLKEQRHRKDSPARDRKSGRSSHHHHHHKPVRNPGDHASEDLEVKCESKRKSASTTESNINTMQSVVVYANESGQVLTLPSDSDQANKLEEMV
ncbi:E3 ubiquitin-protein ligase ZNRF3-like [Ptychodera flava]|uniref:E3 ubiquitin-protein ligase ZNRF3-like n=1 Tax=Ptychodera flava TaxID=63121 RepID=UPI003969D179